ncbi:DUF6506 family protein [Vibrio fluminensis]|uniref:DUF6506 family protein n=1 Tax=Vibrio fluminensis TaxID=2783614 RepID=UPI0018888B92|nr:DUF6506 family protein [Vibrio fluminensis]
MFQRYGFIVKAEGYDYLSDSSNMATTGFSTNMVGVTSDEDAIAVANQMIADGIEVIELCGGFGKESAEYIVAALATDVPIGYVRFDEDEQRKLDSVLSKSRKQ